MILFRCVLECVRRLLCSSLPNLILSPVSALKDVLICLGTELSEEKASTMVFDLLKSLLCPVKTSDTVSCRTGNAILG
jgi:hypothetical protein